MTEPEIHTWWPKLSADAKQALEEMEGALIPDRVREEVERIAGTRMPRDEQLSDTDLQFIRTQREQVD
ncbi:hypothetical protein ACFWHT_12325 [Microbacterium sp. NPDC058342]|uniref:hypothetical protein n=1 Tax=Microbacterium sp. NPDC058342 TaxID=3346454 RepID=UPI0036697924